MLIHRTAAVSEAEYHDAQPKPIEVADQSTKRGPNPNIVAKTGRVAGAMEAEELKILSTSAGKTRVQEMQNFTKDRWSGGKQLFWSGAKPGDRLEFEFTAPDSGDFSILATFTMAADYAEVRCELDGKELGKPVDLYNYPDVITTGELTLGSERLEAGPHKLAIVIAGANASAVRSHMVGLDYVRLQAIQAGPEKKNTP